MAKTNKNETVNGADVNNAPDPQDKTGAAAKARAEAESPVAYPQTPATGVWADPAAEMQRVVEMQSPAIATPAQNAELVHSDPNAPESTRDDYLDAGVPMLPGSPMERQGPEDALGIGPKRGDYTTRIGPSDYQPHTSVYDPITGRTKLVPQRALAEDIADVPGAKGGVDTDPRATAVGASLVAGFPTPGPTEFMNREMGLKADGSPIADYDRGVATDGGVNVTRIETTARTANTDLPATSGSASDAPEGGEGEGEGGTQGETLGDAADKAIEAGKNQEGSQDK